jgi:hypothetical protein
MSTLTECVIMMETPGYWVERLLGSEVLRGTAELRWELRAFRLWHDEE